MVITKSTTCSLLSVRSAFCRVRGGKLQKAGNPTYIDTYIELGVANRLPRNTSVIDIEDWGRPFGVDAA